VDEDRSLECNGATGGRATEGGPERPGPEDVGDKLAAVRKCLAAYHTAAARTAGDFVLTVIENTGRVRTQHFAVGDVDAMAAEALARGNNANVYFAPALLRKDLPRGQRGATGDIVVVLGLVIDDDGDTGKRAVLPPGIEPSIVVTTCQIPCVNRHLHLLFKRPLLPAEAKALAELLHRKCGGDSGTKDVAHVWRLPQTMNYPNAAKIARGRPAEPQSIELTGGSFELIDPDELRQTLEALPDLRSQPRTTNGKGARSHGPAGDTTDRNKILSRLPYCVRQLIEQETGTQGDRSSHCHHVMQTLMEFGLSDVEVRLVSDGAPFAAKYTGRGDLDAEIARGRNLWNANGAKLTAHFGQSAPPLPDGFVFVRGNIFYRKSRKATNDDGKAEYVFVCLIEFFAQTRDDLGDNWGRLIRVHRADGTRRDVAIPMSAVENGGFRTLLMNLGVVLGHSTSAKHALVKLFGGAAANQFALCTSKIGWREGTRFVLPDDVIGVETSEQVVYQHNELPTHKFIDRGTVHEWAEHVAKHCRGNRLISFVIAVSFAPPLLDVVKGENAGFNLHGPSSLGKTTLAHIAASVWGPGGRGGYAQSWRATDNGLEGLAEAHNDCLLVLDDLGECQPEAAGAAAYMLGNGRGKVRAHIDGLPRPVKEWRVIYLSTAEIALSTKIAEGCGPALKAGQAVRLIEISADTGSGYGAFDVPHGFEKEDDCKVAGQRFSNHLVEMTRQYYGTAAPEFIHRVMQHRRTIAAEYPAFQASLCTKVVPPGADG
jgi:hypothetical protein